MPFSFRRLPYLVLKNVLENLDFIELYVLAHVSKRTKETIKRVVKIGNHRVEILIDERSALEFVRTTDRRTVSTICAEGMNQIGLKENEFALSIGKRKKVLSFFWKTDTNIPMLITHWSNKFTGGMDIYRELSELLTVPIKKVSVDLKHVGEDHRKILQWCNKLPNIPVLTYHGSCDFQDYMWIVENARSQNRVDFSMKPRKYHEKGTLRLDVKKVVIFYSSWVELRHLRSMNSELIFIYYATLTDRQINAFLLSLQRGSNRNLKKMHLCFYRYTETDVVIEGLNTVDDGINAWKFQKLAH